jgi:hypothetical protein
MSANYHPRHAGPASYVSRPYHARHASPASHAVRTGRAAVLLAVGATVVTLSACSPGAPLPNPGPVASAQAVAAQAQQVSSGSPASGPHVSATSTR